jgi:hypothetical protein
LENYPEDGKGRAEKAGVLSTDGYKQGMVGGLLNGNIEDKV